MAVFLMLKTFIYCIMFILLPYNVWCKRRAGFEALTLADGLHLTIVLKSPIASETRMLFYTLL